MVNFNLFKFNSHQAYITNEGLESCCITNVWNENECNSIKFVVPDALPLVIMEFASKAQQKISDGDSFTLAGVDELKQFVEAKDEDDGDEDFSGVKTPDDSLVLTEGLTKKLKILVTWQLMLCMVATFYLDARLKTSFFRASLLLCSYIFLISFEVSFCFFNTITAKLL